LRALVELSTVRFQTHTVVAEVRRCLRLALPLIGAQVVSMGNGLVDALVAGQLGPESLAAGGIAAALWFFSALFCIGMMAGLSPLMSRRVGERRRSELGAVFRQGIWLAVLTGVFATLLLQVLIIYLPHSTLQPVLIPLIREYLVVACWSLPFFALVMACRNLCEAVGLAKPVLWVQLVGLLVNTVANLAFGLGWFGAPKLGLTGIGLSTTLVMISMSLVLFMMLHGRQFDRYALFVRFDWPHWHELNNIIRLAVPITLGLVFEAGLFVATTVQMGMLGTHEAAGHYIAMGATSVCYMLPLGLSFAVTARVGRSDGRQLRESVRLRILSAMIIVGFMAVLTALILLLFRYPITALYTNDSNLRHFAASLLLMAAVFQLPDAAQVVLSGVLRGLHDTKVPMLINGFSYWVVAFGIGLIATYWLGYGAYGLWIGLISGLTVASTLLFLRLRWILRQH
jgi:MATE family multidrug resistance protein